MIVEVRDDLHREIGKLALLNDLRMCGLTDAMLEEAMKHREIPSDGRSFQTTLRKQSE